MSRTDASHPATRPSEPSFCKKGSADYSPTRCSRFKQRKRAGRSDAQEALEELLTKRKKLTVDR